MASQTPFILVENVFDRINLNPLATLSTPQAVLPGREVQYIADYRRERTACQAAAATAVNEVRVDLGAGNTAQVDMIWIDRGHNFWGLNITVQTGDDPTWVAAAADTYARAVPAFGTVGGDPTTGYCVTEEGAIYTIFALSSARRCFRAGVASGALQSIFTGVVLGKRVQLLGYSSVVDEDAGDRNVRSEASLIAGYSGEDRTYSARKIEIRLKNIGATEYDSSIRRLRRLLFDVNQPFLCCTNYGVKPERTWLYKPQGNSWSSPTAGVYRSATITGYEYGPLIR